MFAYCNNNPVNEIDPDGENPLAGFADPRMSVVDNARPWESALLALGLLVGAFLARETGKELGRYLLAELESDDPHHIIHGTKRRHEAGWKQFGVDPQKPDGDNWGVILPLLEEVIRNGKVAAVRIVNEIGDKVTYYVEEFKECQAEIVLKIWESADSTVQKISDAWARIK